jgi:hypothetical protein
MDRTKMDRKTFENTIKRQIGLQYFKTDYHNSQKEHMRNCFVGWKMTDIDF